MKTHEAKITDKGQITLPAALRREFGAEIGDHVIFYRDLDGRHRFRIRKRYNRPLRMFDAAVKQTGIGDYVAARSRAIAAHGSTAAVETDE